LNIDISKKRKIEEIIKYCQILREDPPCISELASVSEHDFGKIYRQYFRKAKNQLGIAKF